MIFLPHKTLFALCVLAVLSARAAYASTLDSPLESRSHMQRQRRTPGASAASSHRSHPSKYFFAPATGLTTTPAAAGPVEDTTSRQKSVAFRKARISAAVAASVDRVRRKRAAISAAAHAGDAAGASGGEKARRAVQWARVAPVEERAEALQQRVRAASVVAAGRFSKRGLGAQDGHDDRLEVASAARMEVRLKRMVPLFAEE